MVDAHQPGLLFFGVDVVTCCLHGSPAFLFALPVFFRDRHLAEWIMTQNRDRNRAER